MSTLERDADAPAPVPAPLIEPKQHDSPATRFSLRAKLLTYLVLAPVAILFVAPFAWLISASFQPLSQIFHNPPTWLPTNPTTAGYKGFLDVGHLPKAMRAQGHGDWKWFANSAFVALSITVLQTFFSALCAY
jgi:multiple sugar transport system permease protein